MTTTTQAAPAATVQTDTPEARSLAVLPHLTANFEKADRQILAAYGSSPGVDALMRLWLACGTSREVQREFERAVMDIRRKTLNPPASCEFDEDCI